VAIISQRPPHVSHIKWHFSEPQYLKNAILGVFKFYNINYSHNIFIGTGPVILYYLLPTMLKGENILV
jgi:hypothetical protein